MQGTAAAARCDGWACSACSFEATCGRQYCLQMRMALLKHTTSAIALSSGQGRITFRRIALMAAVEALSSWGIGKPSTWAPALACR